jgi:hypothetical protein
MRGPKLNQLNIKQIALAGLFADDPYGDGIRLESVREPREARRAAMRILDNNAQFWDEKVVREEYLPILQEWTNKDGRLCAAIIRNCRGLV